MKIWSNAKDTCLGQWTSGLETRAARNVVIVATANKLARRAEMEKASAHHNAKTFLD